MAYSILPVGNCTVSIKLYQNSRPLLSSTSKQPASEDYNFIIQMQKLR